MTDPLFISEEDPIDFTCIIDGSSNLQLLHDSDNLADYDQIVHAEHTDLDEPSGIVRVRILDFTVGATSWTISVAHDPGSGSISWSRSSDHAYYDFGPMTAEQEVDVTATSDAPPPVNKERTIKIKISPTGAQPDRPRR